MMEKIWKGIREIFMSPKAKEEKKRRREKIKREESYLNQHLEDMDKDWLKDHPIEPPKYEEIIPDKLGLKKKEYNTRPDEEIRIVAKMKKSPEYDDAKDRKVKEYEKRYQDIKEDIDRIEDERVKDLIGIKDEYKKRAVKERNKNLKNGILKSSIHDLASEEIEGERDKNMKDTFTKAEDAKKVKSDDMESLKRDRDKAIAMLDLKKANAIDDEIERMLKDKRKYNDDVTRYNNDIDAKESKYAMKRRESIKALERAFMDEQREESTHEKFNSYTGAKERNYMKRYELAWNFYNSLPRDEALEAISNNLKLRTYLGKYYSKLMAEQSSRNG